MGESILEAQGCHCSQMESGDLERICAIADRHVGSRGALIAMLESIQQEQGYLPEGDLRLLSQVTGIALVDIYGVATFYRSFSLKPRGKHLICVCLGTACHVRGGAAVVEELSRVLDIPVGETTLDGEFTLETANCLGACALGPIVVVDGQYFSKVKVTDAKDIVAQFRDKADVIEPATEACTAA